MIKVNIIAVGSIKENFYTEAISEYSKRMSRYAQVNIIEVQEDAKEKSISKKIDKESEKLDKVLRGYVILLDRQGELISSEKLAETIDKCQTEGVSEISFIIGGSNGVNEALKSRANKVISFGKITFPHQLFRVVLMEQIYRAFTINNNLPYHK